MEAFLIICLILITVSVVVAVVYLVQTLTQMRKMAAAVEEFVKQAQVSVERVNSATFRLEEIAGLLGSPWAKLAGLIATAIKGWGVLKRFRKGSER